MVGQRVEPLADRRGKDVHWRQLVQNHPLLRPHPRYVQSVPAWLAVSAAQLDRFGPSCQTF